MSSVPPRTLFLAQDVHAVAIEEDFVFLDVRQDRYQCLPGVASVMRLDPTRTHLDVRDMSVGEDLAAASLASWGAMERPSWRSPPTPATSALPNAIEGMRWRDFGEGARCMTDLAATYRGRPIATLAATVQAARQLAPPVRTEMLDLVNRFHRWSPFAPTSAKCLLRAYMLLRLLLRHGHDAAWVFGVTTWPFQAHCWLQCGDLVLDDDVDRVSAFQPILVV